MLGLCRGRGARCLGLWRVQPVMHPIYPLIVLIHQNKTKDETDVLTISRNDNYLRTLDNQFPKRLRESQIPADQQADFTQIRLNNLMRIGSARSQIRSFRVPDIFFAVFAQDMPCGRNEIRSVVQQNTAVIARVPFGRFLVSFYDRAGDDVYLQLFGKGAV